MLEIIKKFATSFKEENELLKEGKIEEAIEKKAESVALLEELAKQAEESQANEENLEGEESGEGENDSDSAEDKEEQTNVSTEAVEKINKMETRFEELFNRVETLEKMKGESKQIQKKQAKNEDNLDDFWDFS